MANLTGDSNTPQVAIDKNLTATQYESAVSSELLNHLDIEPEFIELICDFTGNRYDYHRKVYIKDPHKAKIIANKAGVHILLGMLRPFFSKSATINYLEKEDIYMLMQDFRQELRFIIGTPQQRELIGLNVKYRRYFEGRMTRHAFLNLNRSLDGKELIALTQIHKSQEIVNQSSMQQKTKSINPFTRFMRGSR